MLFAKDMRKISDKYRKGWDRTFGKQGKKIKSQKRTD